MPILAPIVISYWTELSRLFGPWALVPVAMIVALIWWLCRRNAALKTKLDAAEIARDQAKAEVFRLNEARIAEATGFLREMWRVARETENARAARRELDEKFLPVQESMLAILAERGIAPSPHPPESR